MIHAKPRTFVWHGAQSDAARKLAHDIDGRPLTARHVVGRQKAQATWRFRVKHMTRSQRRERAAQYWKLRKGLRDGTLVPLTSTDGLGYRGPPEWIRG